MIVADTMLMAYLVIQTPFSDECQRLRQVEPDWVAPRYVEVELQNVLWQYLRRGDFTMAGLSGPAGEVGSALSSRGTPQLVAVMNNPGYDCCHAGLRALSRQMCS